MGPSPEVPDDEPIACDVPLTRTIAVVTEVDRFTFAGILGELLHITIGGAVGAFNPQWRLVAPDASGVAGCDTFSGTGRECTLSPLAGTYAVEIQDGGLNATGTYSVHIQRLTASERCGTVIACDVPQTTTISTVADTDLHQFTGVAGELLHITFSGAIGAFNPEWRLLAPDAGGVPGCDTFSGTARECTLPVAGAYAIEVEDGGFNATGAYYLHIQRLTASERCGTVIACDVPQSTTIATVADTDLYEFTGVAGELLHITIGGAIGAFNPEWRLLGPNASGVPGCDTFSVTARECTLPGAGAYAIEVEDGGLNATGIYSLQIQRLTASERCGTVIACDVPQTTTISTVADTDLHQFTGVAGELLHITIGGAIGAFTPQWRLLAPSGSGVAGCDTFSTGGRDCSLPLPPVCAPSSGCSFVGEPYAIEVADGGFNATGTYSLHIQRLTAPLRCAAPLFCDVGATATLSALADTDIFELNGFQNEQVHITISGAVGGFNPQWRLIAPNGSGVTGCDTFATGDRECTLPLAGAYAIEVQDSGFDATGTYQLTTVSSLQFCLPPARTGPALIATGPDKDVLPVAVAATVTADQPRPARGALIRDVHPRSNPRVPLVGVLATRSPDRPNPLGPGSPRTQKAPTRFRARGHVLFRMDRFAW